MSSYSCGTKLANTGGFEVNLRYVANRQTMRVTAVYLPIQHHSKRYSYKLVYKTRAVTLTEASILYTDGYSDGLTDTLMVRQIADFSIPPKTFVLRGYNELAH